MVLLKACGKYVRLVSKRRRFRLDGFRMAVNKRWLVLAIAAGITIVYITGIALYEPSFISRTYVLNENYILPIHLNQNELNWRHLYANETKKKFSTLGKIMYFNEEKPPITKRAEPYKILIWKYGPDIEKRHIYHFSSVKHDPLEECSVQNCVLTYKDEDLNTADLVIVHLHRTKGVTDLPPRANRNPKQIWAFLTDESPHHTFLNGKSKLKNFNGIFNWSMTYKMTSDIPVPYGRAILRNYTDTSYLVSEFNDWRKTKRSDVLVAIMNSNCKTANHRWEYVKDLEKHIKVDTYGGCGKLKCPGHFTGDCAKINDYLFYLSFENSNCEDYLTEKLWWNAYHKNSIPIVMGAPKSNLQQHLPPQSYITVEDFASPRDLANYLIYLNNTRSELVNYFVWRSKYTILNEHGYFKSSSRHYCRACEALNYNSKSIKVYDDLETFLSKKDCYSAWDAS